MIRLGLTLRGKIVIITSAILLAVSIYWFTTPRELYIITSIILIMLILSDWIVTRGLLITLDRLRIERIYDEKIYDGEEVDIKIEGRHDPIILPRVIPVLESVVAIVLADLMIRGGFIHPCNLECDLR